MLDKTSKKVLQYILNCPNCTFSVNKEFPNFLSRDAMLACIDYLEEKGYVTTQRVSENILLSATLTHTGRHPKEFNSIALKRYLLDKWIDLLALIISVLAFVGAYRHEISALLQLLMQVLTK